MSRIVFLGTASAVAFEGHQNSHLLIEGSDQRILVDCVGHAVLRLGEAGVHINDLTGVMITHFHPDHVTGLPLLLMNMWLLDRQAPLFVYGTDHALSRMETMMDLFDWREWPDMYPVHYERLPMEEMTTAVEDEGFRLSTSPVEHLVPTLGLRVEFLKEEFAVAYSCDTDPCHQTVRLAEGCDVLIHEASGDYPGHTSAAQAGEIAEQADVGSLYLIHYSFHEKDADTLRLEAEETFSGVVRLAEDLGEISVPA